MITLFGNFCMFLACLTAWLVRQGIFSFWEVIPVFIFIYLTGDLLDGKQARRTNTCSSLGEFLDHFNDILVMGYMVALVCFAYDVHSPALAAFFMAVSYLPLFGSYYEQYYTKTLYFESISSFEAILFATVVACMGFDERIRVMAYTVIFLKFDCFQLVVLAVGTGSVVMLMRNFLRTGRTGYKAHLLWLPMVAIIIALSPRYFGVTSALLVTGVYCACYVERFLLAFVEQRSAPVPDFFFPAFLLLAWITGIPGIAVYWIAVAWQVVALGALFLQGAIPLRKGWIWINPKPGAAHDKA
jgi:phosphatidylglycerophosphate synthase